MKVNKNIFYFSAIKNYKNPKEKKSIQNIINEI